MKTKLVLDRFVWADIRKAIFSSRTTLLIIFLLVLLLGLGILYLNPKNAVAEGIGASLIASAIVSFATILIDHIRSGEQLRADLLLSSGLRQAFPERNITDYENYLPSFTEIDVAGYTLSAFIEANEKRMHERAKRGEKFKVRMLLVHPECSSAVILEEGENKPPGTYSRALVTIKQKLVGLENYVELRLLNRSLPMMIYRIDKILYSGPYPHIGASRNALTLKVEGGWLFIRLQSEFESLWATSKPITVQ